MIFEFTETDNQKAANLLRDLLLSFLFFRSIIDYVFKRSLFQYFCIV